MFDMEQNLAAGEFPLCDDFLSLSNQLASQWHFDNSLTWKRMFRLVPNWLLFYHYPGQRLFLGIPLALDNLQYFKIKVKLGELKACIILPCNKELPDCIGKGPEVQRSSCHSAKFPPQPYTCKGGLHRYNCGQSLVPRGKSNGSFPWISVGSGFHSQSLRAHEILTMRFKPWTPVNRIVIFLAERG